MNAPAARGAMDGQRILVWMCVIIGVNQLGFGALIPVLPLYAQSFGVSTSAIGMTIAIYGLARFAAAMPGAGLSDRFGRRPTIALGGVVSTLGNFWSAFAPGYGEFLIARFVAGAGAGLVMTAGAVVVADISPPDRRGRYMATYMGVFLFAVGIGPFPGGFLPNTSDWPRPSMSMRRWPSGSAPSPGGSSPRPATSAGPRTDTADRRALHSRSSCARCRTTAASCWYV